MENKALDITIEGLCCLVKYGNIQVGDKFQINCRKSKLGIEIYAKEIVYDVFEDHYCDTILYEINGCKRPENGIIPRFRYFAEGFMSSLRPIHPLELNKENFSNLFDFLIKFKLIKLKK